MDKLIEQAKANEEFKKALLEECNIVIYANQPATIEERGALAFRLLSHYPNKYADEHQEALIAEDWINDLEYVELDNGKKFKIPFDVLQEAISRFRKSPDSNFKPMAGKIIEHCKTISGYRFHIADRAINIKNILN